MTAASSYPTPLETLVGLVRDLADREGSLPSRNRVMSEFRVGAEKARKALESLGNEPTGPAVESTTDLVPVQAPSEPEPITGADESAQDTPAVNPVPAAAVHRRTWPVLLLALPAFVAIWSGWVGLGGLTGFGVVHPLPGIADDFALNTAITLPIGVETYAAYALSVWLSPGVPDRARRFARWSAIGSLILGGLGQVAYHLMVAAHVTTAPWPITTLVACLPVAVLGMGAALRHLLIAHEEV